MDMKTKRCPLCCLAKPVSDWYGNKARHDGLSVYCKACMKKKDAERKLKDIAKYLTDAASRQRKYRSIEPELKREMRREDQRKRIQTEDGYWKSREYKWKEQGIINANLTQYERHDFQVMFAQQHSKCAVCKVDDPGVGSAGKHSWCVDHDHKNGIVRGILCQRCNRALGCVKDDIAILRRLIAYLEGKNDEN